MSHDLEEETARRYSAAEIPVFIIRPNWDSIDNLRNEIATEELRFAAATDCSGCQDLDALAKSQDLSVFLARLREQLGRKPRWSSVDNIHRWSMKSDQRGKDLEPEVQSALRERATSLMRFGFAPLPRKLTLNRHLDGAGNLLAMLPGARAVPIADDLLPIFYLDLHSPIVGSAARILIREAVLEYLVANEIPFRDALVSPESAQAEYLLSVLTYRNRGKVT